MAVTSASAANNAYLQAVQSNQANPFRQRRQDFNALAQALGTGDLAGAQKAFASLQQDLASVQQVHSANPAQTTGSSPNRLNDAINALGKALSSGDLSGAQQAFATLQQDMQNLRQSAASQGHHHHHHHGGATQIAPAATAVTGASPSGSGINTTA